MNGFLKVTVIDTHHNRQLITALGNRTDIDGMIEALKEQNLEGIASRMENVLETVTVPEHPEIAQIKDQMMEAGALNAMMSGSGPTVFGIFNDKEQGLKAKEYVREKGLARQIYLVSPYNVRHDA